MVRAYLCCSESKSPDNFGLHRAVVHIYWKTKAIQVPVAPNQSINQVFSLEERTQMHYLPYAEREQRHYCEPGEILHAKVCRY